MRQGLAYLRGVDGWLLLGTWSGMVAASSSLALMSRLQLPWPDASLLAYKTFTVFAVVCGLLFTLRLLRLLNPWETRVFPALTLISFALFFLYFPVFTAVDTPLSRALYDLLNPLLVVMSVGGALGLLSVCIALTLRPR